jgi:hypothetical protein
MRIFGSHRSGPTATASRTSDASDPEATLVADRSSPLDLDHLDQTDEMPILRESVRLAAVPALAPSSSRAPAADLDSLESTTGSPSDGEGNSDVFVCRRSGAETSADEAAAAAAAAAAAVTLFVYGWENVEPGPLSWVFPSLRAALEAVRTMRNAIGWSICSGTEWADVDVARARGAVLVEQHG